MDKQNDEEYERRMRFARQQAGRAWATDKTSSTIIDVILAEEFAKILVDHMYESHLGCATTKELLDEIAARLPLDYKTIGVYEQKGKVK